MAKRTPIPFNTGVGRFIGGSCYEGQTVNEKGEQLIYGSGAKKGQPRTDYSVGIAVRKTQQHWANEPWGAAIWKEGHEAWPNGQAQRPDFAWKIVDGDSTIPNKKGVKPCDRNGYPGHWILWFTGTDAPNVAVAISGPAQWNNQPGVCMPGDYIEISGSVVSNESDQTAGVYLNYAAVCLRGYHPDGRISAAKIDLATAGFGQSALPAGAVMQPAGGNALPAAAPPVPGASLSTAGASPVPVPSAPVASAPPAPVGVAPNPAILGAPPPVAVPSAPVPLPVVQTPPAPVAAAPRMLKNGGVYDDWIKAGWTDETLRNAGHL